MIQVNLVTQMIQVNLITQMIQVNLVTQMIQVNLVTQMIQVNLVTQMIQVNLVTQMIQVNLVTSNPNTDNFFSACETAIKQYSELVETLQIECVKSWKKITDSTAVSTQQSLIIGNNNERGCSMPDYAQKIIDESMNHATRFIQFQNNMSSQAFAMMIKNIRTVNENPNPIMEFSKSWLNFWNNIGLKNK